MPGRKIRRSAGTVESGTGPDGRRAGRRPRIPARPATKAAGNQGRGRTGVLGAGPRSPRWGSGAKIRLIGHFSGKAVSQE